MSEATAEKKDELAVREKNVSGLEEEKKAVKAEAAKVQKTKEEIAPYIERINTLEEDEKNIQNRQAELDDQAQKQHFKEFNLTTREKELDKRTKTQEQKEKEADERIAFEKEKIESDKEEVSSRSLVLDERESALDSKVESIEADRIRNEEVAKENEEASASLNLKCILQKPPGPTRMIMWFPTLRTAVRKLLQNSIMQSAALRTSFRAEPQDDAAKDHQKKLRYRATIIEEISRSQTCKQ